MLIKREILEAIRAGDIDLQFRRWTRPTVKPGGTLKTPLGLLRIGAITDVRPEDVSEADAHRAGFADLPGSYAQNLPRLSKPYGPEDLAQALEGIVQRRQIPA